MQRQIRSSRQYARSVGGVSGTARRQHLSARQRNPLVLARFNGSALFPVAVVCVLLSGGCGNNTDSGAEAANGQSCVDANTQDMSLDEAVDSMKAHLYTAPSNIEPGILGQIELSRTNPDLREIVAAAPMGSQARFTQAVCDLSFFDDTKLEDKNDATHAVASHPRGSHGYVPHTGWVNCLTLKNSEAPSELLATMQRDVDSSASDPQSQNRVQEERDEILISKAALQFVCPQFNR